MPLSMFDINKSLGSSKGFKLSNRTNTGDTKSLERNGGKMTKTSQDFYANIDQKKGVRTAKPSPESTSQIYFNN